MKLKNATKIITQITSDKFLAILIILIMFFGIYSRSYWLKNYKFISGSRDIGFELNSFFNFSRKITMVIPFSEMYGANILYGHLSFTAILCAIIFSIYPTMGTYFFLHGITLTIGSIPIYKIAETKFNSKKLAFLLGLGFLLNPLILMQLKLTPDFEVYQAVPFILFMWYFYEKKNFRYFILFLTLSLLTKENISLLAIFFGIYCFYNEKNKKWTIYPIIGGIVILLLYAFVMFKGYTVFPNHYEDLIRTHFGEDATKYKLIMLPIVAIRNIFLENTNNASYLVNIFSIFMFLPIIGYDILLIAIPKIVENLAYIGDKNIYLWSNNNAILIPIFFVSSIYAIKRLSSRLKKFPKFRNQKIITYLIIFLLFLNYARILHNTNTLNPNMHLKENGLDYSDFCPLPNSQIMKEGGTFLKYEKNTTEYDKRWDYIIHLKEKIPENSIIGIDGTLALAFVNRENTYIINENRTNIYPELDYVILNKHVMDCIAEKKLNTGNVITIEEWDNIENNFDVKKLEEKHGIEFYQINSD